MTTVLVMPQDAIDADRAGWLDRRKGGITGTDVASLLGLSVHLTPFGLYHAKLSGIESEDKPVLRRGRLLEAEVDSMLREEHPHLATARAGLYAHAGQPWQMATLDRWLLDTEAASAVAADLFRYRPPHSIPGVVPAEYKTWATKDGWADPGRGVIGDGNQPRAMPVSVRCQAIWNMHVAGAESILVVVLWMMPWQIGVYRITAADAGVHADLCLMRAEAGKFLRRLHQRDEPDVDDQPATTMTLRKLHPSLTDTEVRVPLSLWRSYHRARAAQARAKAKVTKAQNRLLYRMGDAARAVVVIPEDGRERTIRVCSRSISDTPVQAHTRHVDKLTPGRTTP